uniref:cytochrome c oxidase subunit III n=1 Tax=Charinus ferreus TaxID=3034938 RepID=UPI0024111891|nr:cytochrome c oxidase subunit III [Charinus ferreus]WEM34688.1 cytochrome c oxidase subunit 3 [Charinus ferreus]WEM34701.1 cytochrome c oxidase subunit 3 [Charinus ferreus]WEM34714.1 cytochrome c oxidase subunit 3 [Charinus ferreus]
MTKQSHPYHMVNFSPWPLTAAAGSLALTTGMIKWFHFNSMNLFFLGLLILATTTLQWWRDTIREATFQGHHTLRVMTGLRVGMILFILSEVLFFVSFFWAFFHSSLSPNIELGTLWPPKSISPFNPLHIPLLNTAILLASGVTVTWAHHNLLKNKINATTSALLLTLILGLYFTILQGWEYHEAPFSISDSAFGTTFFVATGFHGLHVIIGSTFIAITLTRSLLQHLSSTHHFGFEAMAWYWHFVDVVWLFLYTAIYWWGS